MMDLVFLFPGQGSQKVGMCSDFYAQFESVRKKIDSANEILGRNLKKIIFEGPVEDLTMTQNTQPALFTVETSICDLLKENNINPALALGHSLGEYSALYAAGAYSFEDGLRIVARRGELMAEAGKTAPGAMAAVIGLPLEKIRSVLADVNGIVVTANENSPEQTVISGEVDAVRKAGGELSSQGAKRVINLPVSGAFHSPLMKPAGEEFKAFLEKFTFNAVACPVVSNVTAKPETDPSVLRELLVRQLVSPVRWVDSMAYVSNYGNIRCVEAGPGSVLQGLARKCGQEIKVLPCETVDNLYSILKG